MFGFLNVYKPVGMTSHDVVAILRRQLKIKQIGHTGTLDPFAQGVLPIAIGKATRLIEYLADDKEYLAEVSFGKSTDTYDREGETTFESDKKITKEQLLAELKNFEGEIVQTPPIYSALKVNGKKLYDYAREGKEVKIEPRKIFIEKIELKEFDEEKQVAKIDIKCSKGTYIRSIANDLGQNLGVGAYLSELIRTQAGAFFAQNSIKLDKIDSEVVKNALINPLDVINLPKYELNDVEEKKVSFGQKLVNKTTLQNSELLILVYNNDVKSIAQIEGNMVKSKKVF